MTWDERDDDPFVFTDEDDDPDLPIHDREGKLRKQRGTQPEHGRSLKRLLNERVAKSQRQRDWDWEQRKHKWDMMHFDTHP